ncbi:MAG: TetR/AcrR family transcriptional regulator [Nakamurella sp.]
MPKIDAPTVAEHHAMRRAAVIAAARHALGTVGAAGVTPGAVSGAAGIARTSVYQYFPSTDALLTAAVEDMFAEAESRISEALDGSTDPWQRVESYIAVALRAAAGQYGPFHAMPTAQFPDTTRARLRELHDALSAPLVDAVTEIGAADPKVATVLILGAISAGITLARHGANPEATIKATNEFVAHGLGR